MARLSPYELRRVDLLTQRDTMLATSLEALTDEELEDRRMDLCALETKVECDRQALLEAERAIEWDRVCTLLGMHSNGIAELTRRAALLREHRVRLQARDKAAQLERVRIDEVTAVRALLRLQAAARAVPPEQRTSEVGGLVVAFFARFRNTMLVVDEKTAAPALCFSVRRMSEQEPRSSFGLVLALAPDGHVLAADNQAGFRHFNILQDHPSLWFER